MNKIITLLIVLSLSIFLISATKLSISDAKDTYVCGGCHEEVRTQLLIGNLHNDFICTDCHIVTLNETSHDIVTTISCTTCHQDVHVETIHTNMSCTSCHSNNYNQIISNTSTISLTIDMSAKTIRKNN